MYSEPKPNNNRSTFMSSADRYDQPRETRIVIHDNNRTQVRVMRIASDDSGLVEVEFSETEIETTPWSLRRY